jgi:hypothetical protein
MQDRIKSFLEELAVLTIKFDIAIGGCGCSGSPYICDTSNNNYILKERLKYDIEEKIYTAEEPDNEIHYMDGTFYNKDGSIYEGQEYDEDMLNIIKENDKSLLDMLEGE